VPFISAFGLPRGCGTLYMLIEREGVYFTSYCIVTIYVADGRMFSGYCIQHYLYFSAYCIVMIPISDRDYF
jgi:hypothetical protein